MERRNPSVHGLREDLERHPAQQIGVRNKLLAAPFIIERLVPPALLVQR
jgi:hypothetical protein